METQKRGTINYAIVTIVVINVKTIIIVIVLQEYTKRKNLSGVLILTVILITNCNN